MKTFLQKIRNSPWYIWLSIVWLVFVYGLLMILFPGPMLFITAAFVTVAALVVLADHYFG